LFVVDEEPAQTWDGNDDAEPEKKKRGTQKRGDIDQLDKDLPVVTGGGKERNRENNLGGDQASPNIDGGLSPDIKENWQPGIGRRRIIF